jgi:hemoglobin
MDLAGELGGATRCRELATAFYARVAKDPVLRPLFPGKTFNCAIEEFTAFLLQFVDGPSEDTQRRWWLSLRESHQRFKITPEARAAWMRNMTQALEDVDFSESFRAQLLEFFKASSAYVHSGEDRAVTGHLASRWKAQVALDRATAAVQSGNLDAARAFLATPELTDLFRGRPSILAGFIGLLIRAVQNSYAVELLNTHEGIAHEKYNGRTLLHIAAGAGNVPLVQLLLSRWRIDPNVRDGGRHTPLYYVANEAGTREIVAALVNAGADVNACDGVMRCTPLHMAARRGNLELCEALLDQGANINARDTRGDTPLKRAVNCKKAQAARLLRSRGAR